VTRQIGSEQKTQQEVGIKGFVANFIQQSLEGFVLAFSALGAFT